MATINGTAVNFGYQGTDGITITGISGTLLQSTDHSKAADVESARNGLGDIVARGWYDIHDEATLEWIITGTNLAASLTNTTLSTVEPGDIIVISACTSMPALVATNWEVQSGAKIVGSNTTFKKLSCTIHKRAGITAAAS
jgi:hypothetical protein